MKKIVALGLAGLGVIALAGVVAFRSMAAREPGFATEVSPKAAKLLQEKIDRGEESIADRLHFSRRIEQAQQRRQDGDA